MLHPVDRAILLQSWHGLAGYNVWSGHRAACRVDANGNALCGKGYFQRLGAPGFLSATFVQEGMPPQDVHSANAGYRYPVVFFQTGKIA